MSPSHPVLARAQMCIRDSYETSDIIATYVYRQGMVSGNMSYASAIGLFLSLIHIFN